MTQTAARHWQAAERGRLARCSLLGRIRKRVFFRLRPWKVQYLHTIYCIFCAQAYM